MSIQIDNTNAGTLTLKPGASGTYSIVFPIAVAAVNGYVLSSDTSGNLSWVAQTGGGGTVTAVSVASANGFAGSSGGGATPALTISTSITGLLKGNATAISAAVAGTDYQAAVSATGILKSSGVSGNVSAAVAGTDYIAPAGTFFIGTTSIAHNRATAAQSLTGINIDGIAGVGTTVTTTASTANSDFKIPLLNTTGVATGNFGLLLDSSAASDFTYNPSTNVLTAGIIRNGTYNQTVSQNSAATAAGYQELFRIASSNLTTSGTFALSATRGGFVHGSNYVWTSSHNGTGMGTLIMLSSGNYANIDVALDVSNNGDVIISANWGAAQTYGITVNVQIGGVVSFATVGTAWTAPNTGYTRRVSFTTFGNGTRIDQLFAASLGVGTTPNGTSGDVTAAGYVIESTAITLTAAGTTQGTALLLAKQINDVTVVAASSGVRLPVAVAGMRIIVRNSSVTNLNVYPNTGAQIQTLGTNVAMVLVSATMLEYVAVSATQWYLMNSVFA